MSRRALLRGAGGLLLSSRILAASVPGLAFLSGCAPEEKSGKKQVFTSFFLLADWARKIVGEKMDVQCVMPPGADVHGWEPTPKRLMQMLRGDAFLFNGAGLEPWTAKFLPELKKKNVPIFEAARSVELFGTHDCGHDHSDGGHGHGDCGHDHSGGGHGHGDCGHDHSGGGHAHGDCGHDHSGPDPHIWLSLRNAAAILKDLTAFFSNLEPENAAFFESNLQENLAVCTALDAEFQAFTETLSCRKLVVGHRAFGYLCRDYGLEQEALEGFSSYSDPSPAQMVKIVEFVRANQIPVIFAASSENTKGTEAVAREIGIQTAVLYPLGTLTQEQLDGKADYFSVMRENLASLKLLAQPSGASSGAESDL